MNALQIIREVCPAVGISVPNSVVGSADVGVRQLLALLNKEGRDLSQRYAWEVLIREASHTTTATQDQGTLETIIGATNAHRFIINETMFNRTQGVPVLGPNSPLDWQLRQTLGLTGPYPEYRIRGGRLLLLPTPAAGESLYFEYVSKNWATDSTGTTQKRAVTADEDLILLDDEIVLLGLEWRWRKAKGLDYTEDFNEYESKVSNAMTRDGTKRRVSLASRNGSPERRVIAPAGSWPL